MRINKSIKIIPPTAIPAHEEEVLSYIAKDGTVFAKECDCVRYDGLPDLPRMRKIQFPLCDVPGDIFFVKTIDEFMDLSLYYYYMNYVDRIGHSDYHGEDWYMFEVWDGHDSPGACNVYSLTDLKKWKSKTEQELEDFVVAVEQFDVNTIKEMFHD